MHLFDIKALAVQTTISSNKNRRSSKVSQHLKKGIFQTQFCSLFLFESKMYLYNISVQRFKLGISNSISFFQKREMQVPFLLLMCWLPSLITARGGREPARLGKCTFSKTSRCCAATGVGFMLIDPVLFLQSQFEGCKFCILAKLYIQGYCNCTIGQKISLDND